MTPRSSISPVSRLPSGSSETMCKTVRTGPIRRIPSRRRPSCCHCAQALACQIGASLMLRCHHRLGRDAVLEINEGQPDSRHLPGQQCSAVTGNGKRPVTAPLARLGLPSNCSGCQFRQRRASPGWLKSIASVNVPTSEISISCGIGMTALVVAYLHIRTRQIRCSVRECHHGYLRTERRMRH